MQRVANWARDRILWLMLAVFAGGATARAGDSALPPYQSYRELPGITAAEIAAIEALKVAYPAGFRYGMPPSREMFANFDPAPDRVFGGYAAYLCEYFSSLFGIPFTPAIYPRAIFGERWSRGEIDFTHDDFPAATATPPNSQTCATAGAIAIRAVKTYHLKSAPPLIDAALPESGWRYALRKNSALTANAAIAELRGTPDLVEDYAAASQYLRDNPSAYFIDDDASPIQAENPEIIADDFYPLQWQFLPLVARRAELAPLISAIDRALAAPEIRRYFLALYERGSRDNLRRTFLAALAPAEYAFLKSARRRQWRMAIEYDYYPITFWNERDAQWQGIAVDLLRQIAEITGLTIVPANAPGATFAELIEMVAADAADFFTELIRTPERIKAGYVYPANDYALDNYALISADKYPPVSLREIPSLRVGIQQGTAFGEIFRAWFPQSSPVVYDTTDKLFYGLIRGEIDLVFASRNNLLLMTNFLEQPGFKINYLFQYRVASTLGFPPRNAQLCAVFDKAMRMIDMKNIENAWVRRGSVMIKNADGENVRDYHVAASVSGDVLAVANIPTGYGIYSKFGGYRRGEHTNINDCEIVAKEDIPAPAGAFDPTLWDIAPDDYVIGKALTPFDEYILVNGYAWTPTLPNVPLTPADVDAMRESIGNKYGNWVRLRGWTGPGPYVVLFINDGSVQNWISTKNISEIIGADIIDVGYRRKLSQERMPYLLAIAALLLLLLIIAAAMIRRRKLLHQQLRTLVNDRTRNLCEQTEIAVRALESAADASRAKSRFLARMSHELRTPLNVIIGLSACKKNSPVHGGKGENSAGGSAATLTQINTAGHYLLKILNDILDLAAIERRQIALRAEEFPLFATLRQNVDFFQPRCAEKKISLVVKLPLNREYIVVGDSTKLSQIVMILLDNAVKFTPANRAPRGEITFTALAEEIGPAKLRVNFSVRDNGIGMDDERRRQMLDWEPEIGSDSDFMHAVSNGSGLVICKELLHLLGGQLACSSQKDAGSNFNFVLHFPRVAREIAAAENSAANETAVPDWSGGKRVLIVDDVSLNREVLINFLNGTGIEIDEAEDGAAAIEKFSAAAIGYYSLILMDINMPHLGGYAATRAIRSLSRADAATVPIIAVTANAFPEDLQKSFAAGMQAHLAKPVEYENLLDTIAGYLPA